MKLNLALKVPRLFCFVAGFILALLFVCVGLFVYAMGQTNFQIGESERERWLAARKGQVAFITGASSGIGFALAKKAGQLGMRLVLVDINPQPALELKQRIEEKGGECLVFPADLTIEKERQASVVAAFEKFGRVDFLFNNAGYGYIARLENLDIKEARKQFELNFWAAVDLTRLIAPAMRKQKSGWVVNIGSVVGFFPEMLPGSIGVYTASKAALHAWSRNLREELAPDGISVRVVSPSGVKTNFFKSMKGPDTETTSSAANTVWATFNTPEEIAEEIFNFIPEKKLFIFPGWSKAVFHTLSAGEPI